MALMPILMFVLDLSLISVFIYLAYTVRRRKSEIFHDGVDPVVAEKRYERLRTSLQVAGVAAVVAVVGTIAHNVVYAITDEEELIWFFIGGGALTVFFFATLYSFFLFLRGRRAAL